MLGTHIILSTPPAPGIGGAGGTAAVFDFTASNTMKLADACAAVYEMPFEIRVGMTQYEKPEDADALTYSAPQQMLLTVAPSMTAPTVTKTETVAIAVVEDHKLGLLPIQVRRAGAQRAGDSVNAGDG